MKIKLWLVRAGSLLLSILFIGISNIIGKSIWSDGYGATELSANLEAVWNIGVIVIGVLIYTQCVSFYKSKSIKL